MNDCKIVPMKTEEEIEGKAYVHWRSWHETYTNLIPSEYLTNITLEKCIRLAHRFPQNTLVLKEEDQVIGFACYGDNEDGTGELIAIYLLAEYHGKKLGYALMNAVFDHLADKNKVTLWVLKGNDRAIDFYTRYGFRFDGTEKNAAVGTELKMVWNKRENENGS